jgi:hypothetical protein
MGITVFKFDGNNFYYYLYYNIFAPCTAGKPTISKTRISVSC